MCNLEVLISWGTSKFTDLDSGKYTYSLWFNYLGGKSGAKSGCINIPDKSAVLVEYKTAIIVTSSGNVAVKSLTGSGSTSC